ncbi:hypothetical protein C8Q80DRAFT_442687 [Daedaleopsis nitida]|nr:hypothetical protein C8Q80DRAFT_442687 [Daedaleopsis nitida]
MDDDDDLLPLPDPVNSMDSSSYEDVYVPTTVQYDWPSTSTIIDTLPLPNPVMTVSASPYYQSVYYSPSTSSDDWPVSYVSDYNPYSSSSSASVSTVTMTHTETMTHTRTMTHTDILLVTVTQTVTSSLASSSSTTGWHTVDSTMYSYSYSSSTTVPIANRSSTFSPGVLAGITVGAIATVAAICALLVVLVRRRTNSSAPSPSSGPRNPARLLKKMRRVRPADRPLRLPSPTPSELEASRYTRVARPGLLPSEKLSADAIRGTRRQLPALTAELLRTPRAIAEYDSSNMRVSTATSTSTSQTLIVIEAGSTYADASGSRATLFGSDGSSTRPRSTSARRQETGKDGRDSISVVDMGGNEDDTRGRY